MSTYIIWQLFLGKFLILQHNLTSFLLSYSLLLVSTSNAVYLWILSIATAAPHVAHALLPRAAPCLLNVYKCSKLVQIVVIYSIVIFLCRCRCCCDSKLTQDQFMYEFTDYSSSLWTFTVEVLWLSLSHAYVSRTAYFFKRCILYLFNPSFSPHIYFFACIIELNWVCYYFVNCWFLIS